MFDFGVAGRPIGAGALSFNAESLTASLSWLAATPGVEADRGALLSFPSLTSPSSSSAGGADVALVCVSGFLLTGRTEVMRALTYWIVEA